MEVERPCLRTKKVTYTYHARIWELVPGGSFFQGRYSPLHSKSEPRDLSSQKRKKKLCLKAPSSIPFQMAFAYQLCHYAYLTEMTYTQGE